MAAAPPRPRPRTDYTRTAIVLHWGIAALVLTTIPIGWYGATHDSPRGNGAIGVHQTIGVAILALSLVRVGWRLRHKPPALPASVSPMLRRIANLTHALFYALLVVLPLSGWWLSSAAPDRAAAGFGPLAIPTLPVARGAEWLGSAHLVHTRLAWLAIALVGLHVLAVLKHLTMDDDGVAVVARMFPAAD